MTGYIPYYQLADNNIVESVPSPYEYLVRYAAENFPFEDPLPATLGTIVESSPEIRNDVMARLREKRMNPESGYASNDDGITIHALKNGYVTLRFGKITKDGRRRKFRYCATFDFTGISSFIDLCPGNPAILSYYEFEGMNILSNIFSMIAACSYLDDFYPRYKKIYMRARSISSIVHGIVDPVCDCTKVDFMFDGFTVMSAISDTVVCRRRLGYEDYINGIRDYADKLKQYMDGHKN